jgi:hypothetical protein
MSNITDIVDAIISKNGAEATEQIQSELSQRAVDAIDSMRAEVAANMFMPQQHEVVDSSDAVVETESAEGTVDENV